MADAKTYNSEMSNESLRQRQVAARLERTQKTENGLSYEDREWVDNMDRSVDVNNFDESKFDREIENHRRRYPTDTKNPKKKKKVSARRRVLARRIIKKIKKERFEGITFYSAIILAGILDLICILPSGILGTVIGIIINPLLSIILWKIGSSRVKTKAKRMIIMSLFESIPFWNMMPWWTGMIIKMKIEHNNKVRKLERALKKLRKK